MDGSSELVTAGSEHVGESLTKGGSIDGEEAEK